MAAAQVILVVAFSLVEVEAVGKLLTHNLNPGTGCMIKAKRKCKPPPYDQHQPIATESNSNQRHKQPTTNIRSKMNNNKYHWVCISIAAGINSWTSRQKQTVPNVNSTRQQCSAKRIGNSDDPWQHIGTAAQPITNYR